MTLSPYNVSRRSFLTALTAALAALTLSPRRLLAAEDSLIRKTIPASGERLPSIGMGTSRTLEIGTNQREFEALVDVLQAFFANGGTVIDSSPMYGSAERILGKLLDRVGHRQQLFAATKVWTDGKQAGIRQMEQSRELWDIPRFDLMQIHNLRDWRTHLDTLKAWKAEGKIRYIGITTSHGRYHAELEDILRREDFDFVQLSYNIDNRSVETRLLPLAAERGVAVLINRPYQRGFLFHEVKGKPLPDWATEIDCTTWGQFFLKFIISHPAVTCAIPATTKVEHMRDNMAAGHGRLPDAAMRTRMLDYFQAI